MGSLIKEWDGQSRGLACLSYALLQHMETTASYRLGVTICISFKLIKTTGVHASFNLPE